MSVVCPLCNSEDVAKKGFRYNLKSRKQKYRCCTCEYWFVEDDGFKRMRNSPETIVRAIHQHEDGFSLSKVQNHLWQHDHVKVTKWAIARWVQKYSDFLKSASFGGNTCHKRKNTHG